MKNLQLLQNEEVVWENEADQWFVSSNPFVKLVLAIAKFFGLIFGVKMKGHIIVTNRRIVYQSSKYFLWCIKQAISVDTIYLHQVSSLSFGYEASFLCFCKSKIMKVNSTGSAGTQFVIKSISEQDLERKVNQLSEIIIK